MQQILSFTSLSTTGQYDPYTSHQNGYARLYDERPESQDDMYKDDVTMNRKQGQ